MIMVTVDKMMVGMIFYGGDGIEDVDLGNDKNLPLFDVSGGNKEPPSIIAFLHPESVVAKL